MCLRVWQWDINSIRVTYKSDLKSQSGPIVFLPCFKRLF